MTMRYIFFYATPDDIGPVLQTLEGHAPLKFIETGIFSAPGRNIYLNAFDLPNVGIAQPSLGASCPTYMVSHRAEKNHLHCIAANDGRKLWSLRNGDNAESVLLKLGGLSRTGAVLEGQMATLHTTSGAQQLMVWFLSALERQSFTRIHGCWIGPAALVMLKAGARLTQAEQAPRDCDIKWPSA